jgi:GTP-binding protein
MELEAGDHQLDCPFLYAVGREGWPCRELDDERKDLTPLFETIVETIPRRAATRTGPFQMLVSTIDYSPYLGRLAIGRIERGVARVGDPVCCWSTVTMRTTSEAPARAREDHQALRLQRAGAARGGDGLRRRHRRARRAPAWRSAPPSATRSARGARGDPRWRSRRSRSTSWSTTRPSPGREGSTSPAGRSATGSSGAGEQRRAAGRGDRLARHAHRLGPRRAAPGHPDGDDAPRGLRVRDLAAARDPEEGRAGSCWSRTRRSRSTCPRTLMGPVIEKLGQRRGEMLEMKNPGGGLVRLVYRMPARGLFGYRSEFLTDTRGEGILHHRFLEYGPYVGSMNTRSAACSSAWSTARASRSRSGTCRSAPPSSSRRACRSTRG